jgi:hypothetical protein
MPRLTEEEKACRRQLLHKQALNYYCATCNSMIGYDCQSRSGVATTPHRYRTKQARAHLVLRKWRTKEQWLEYVAQTVADGKTINAQRASKETP